MSKKGAILIGSAATLIGIVYFLKRKLEQAYLMSFGAKNFSVKSINLQRAVIGLDFIIKNEGELGVSFTGADINIYADNKYVGSVKTDKKFSITPNSETVVPVEFTTSPKLFKDSVGGSLLGGNVKNVQIKFKGKLRIVKMGIPLGIPFSYSMPIKDMM